MRRDLTARRPSTRTLAGTALLLATGVGTALGAGTASAAPAVPDLPGADQVSPEAVPASAPNLTMTDGTAETTGQGHDIGNVTGEDLAVLGSMTNGQLSGLAAS